VTSPRAAGPSGRTKPCDTIEDTVPVIPVNTPSAAYNVTISPNLLPTLHSRLRKLNPEKPFRPFIITSPNIWALWSKPFLASFKESPTVLFHPAGERHKRMSSVESLAQQLSTAGADRDALLLAFGGGVIGDITGFLAAIYMRGIRYVQIPTTLLAQVDSSIGGKTGVNLLAGKNLIGSFHHPQAVLADTDLLRTLPPRELRAGLQESVKAAIIYDANLFRYMEQNAEAILSTKRNADTKALTKVVAASVRVKADVVSKDEKESGLRMILNFGHTIGHAIESATNYKQLLHGEAVAWGSIAALSVAVARNTITEKDANRIVNLILRYGPLPPFKATAKKLVALTARDKKNRSGTRSFVLPTAIGHTEIVRDVTEAELLAATNAMLTLMHHHTAASTNPKSPGAPSFAAPGEGWDASRSQSHTKKPTRSKPSPLGKRRNP
jgi:3-dehydroquinate synthase